MTMRSRQSETLRLFILAAFLAALELWGFSAGLSSQAPAKIEFGRDVLPIFRQNCLVVTDRRSKSMACPVEESTRGRLLVCQNMGGGIPAVFRERLPAWRRSMDFSRRHKLGHDGADAGFASSRGQFNIQRANSLALAVNERKLRLCGQ